MVQREANKTIKNTIPILFNFYFHGLKRMMNNEKRYFQIDYSFLATRIQTHTHTHGIRGASICVKSLVDRDIYESGASRSKDMRYHSLTKRFIFL